MPQPIMLKNLKLNGFYEDLKDLLEITPPKMSFSLQGTGMLMQEVRRCLGNLALEFKRREYQKNIYFCFIDCTNGFDYVVHKKLRKILEMGIPDHLICLLRNLYAGQEATERNMERQTGSKLGKEHVKGVHCHPAYLTSMQSTS